MDQRGYIIHTAGAPAALEGKSLDDPVYRSGGDRSQQRAFSILRMIDETLSRYDSLLHQQEYTGKNRNTHQGFQNKGSALGLSSHICKIGRWASQLAQW